MTLLSVAQSVCDEVGLPRPSAVATSTEQLARQMFSLANAELRLLSKSKDWPLLVREHTFDTVIGTPQYSLPAGYRNLIGNTIFNSDLYYKMKGSVSPQEWQHTKALNLGSLSCAKVRIYGQPNKINIVPTPASVETVVFEYKTNYFALTAANAEIPLYAADSDASIIEEDLVRLGLKWRIKHAKGLEFSADFAEYNGAVSAEFARQLASPDIMVGGNRLTGAPELTSGYVRENGFG